MFPAVRPINSALLLTVAFILAFFFVGFLIFMYIPLGVKKKRFDEEEEVSFMFFCNIICSGWNKKPQIQKRTQRNVGNFGYVNICLFFAQNNWSPQWKAEYKKPVLSSSNLSKWFKRN
jgi:hypothetical protein